MQVDRHTEKPPSTTHWVPATQLASTAPQLPYIGRTGGGDMQKASPEPSRQTVPSGHVRPSTQLRWQSFCPSPVMSPQLITAGPVAGGPGHSQTSPQPCHEHAVAWMGEP